MTDEQREHIKRGGHGLQFWREPSKARAIVDAAVGLKAYVFVPQMETPYKAPSQEVVYGEPVDTVVVLPGAKQYKATVELIKALAVMNSGEWTDWRRVFKDDPKATHHEPLLRMEFKFHDQDEMMKFIQQVQARLRHLEKPIEIMAYRGQNRIFHE